MACVIEDDQILEIETQEPMTDCLSETEQGKVVSETESDSGKVIIRTNWSGKTCRVVADPEISFLWQQNNNATIVDVESESSQPEQTKRALEDSIEDGEISLRAKATGVGQSEVESDIEKVIENKIGALMTKVQDFFE